MAAKRKARHNRAMLLPRRTLLGAIGTLPLIPVAHGISVHRLTILHVNDVHARHEPVDSRALTCTPGPAAPTCFGSTPRLAAAIREQRAAAEADGRTVILLDGGDQFQGSLFFTAHHGMAELAVQHATGTDAMVLGNHEFDDGPETLGRYIAAAGFPVLSANIDAADEPHLAGRIKPFVILERGGLRIAVIGLTTLETRTSSSPGPRVRFSDPRSALARYVAEARAEGATVIVALSHLGLPADLALGPPGLAAIIGGHSHSLLSNTEPGAVAPYPAQGADGAPIVQAGAYARYLGRLDLDLAADGAVLARSGGCRHIGADLVPDPEVQAIVAAYAAPLKTLRRRRITTLAEPLDNAACRIAPCRLGALAAQSLRDAVHQDAAGLPVIGLMNAGGLRAGLPAGPVTLGQVLETMPFGNMLATLTLTGADLHGVVRHGLSKIGQGGFAQWAGLRLGPAPSIEIEHSAGTWLPLDESARYMLATNSFLRTGGDGYMILRDRAEAPYDTGPGIADLFAAALAR